MSDTNPKANDPYFLCRSKCRTLCVYLGSLTKNMPKYEKYVLSSKIREVGYTLMELAVASHLKFNKKTDLTKLNINKELLKDYLQVALDTGYIDLAKYRHSMKLLNDVGKQLVVLLAIEQKADF